MWKTCKKCDSEKGLEAFYPDKRGALGRSPICRDCAGYTKTCSKCGVEKPLDAFDKDARNCSLKGKGVIGKCKECCRTAEAKWREGNTERVRVYQSEYYQNNKDDHRDYLLRTKYGITKEQYDSMLAAQGGKCAICKGLDPKGRGTFHVDHNHATGEIRGLLCHGCNTGLGNMQDSIDILLEAVKYLSRK